MSAIQTGQIQFFHPDTGRPVANGWLATYQEDGITPKPTFSDISEQTNNENPVRLDASGCAFLFGSGAYTFKVYDSCNNLVRTITNIGFVQSGSSIPDQDTPEIFIGDTETQFNGDDWQVIYDDNLSVIGRVRVSTAHMAGASGAGGVVGEYETVVTTFAEGGSEIPAGTVMLGDPQEGYTDESKRLYRLTSGGSSSINPESDLGVDQFGRGENYDDLMRIATSEEVRVKKLVGQWENLNEVISSGELSYPIMCFGNDGELYKTTGSPTATQILETNPVDDTDRLVWVYVYDPTETAQYPPAYRALTGIDYNSSSSIKCPIQYQKLKDSTGAYVDDGTPTAIYYKSLSTWAYGAGSSGTPIGGGATGAINANGWYDTYQIKTESGVVDYCHISQSVDLFVAGLPAINALAAEIAAGRTWVNARRVGSFKVDTTNVVEWDRLGSEYVLPVTTTSSNITANGNNNTTVFSPPSQMARFSVYVSNVAHEDMESDPEVGVLGKDQSSSGGLDCESYSNVEHDVNYKSRGGAEFVRIADSNSQVNIHLTGNESHTFNVKSQSWIDQLTD